MSLYSFFIHVIIYEMPSLQIHVVTEVQKLWLMGIEIELRALKTGVQPP
jgi:hypothetical protein